MALAEREMGCRRGRGEGHFPTPSGKIELFSERMVADGYPGLPTYVPLVEAAQAHPDRAQSYPLRLLSPAAHHQTSSTHAQQAALLPSQGNWLEIAPVDAADRGLHDGDRVRVWNDRGECELVARIVPGLQPGLV